ncbi:MAG: SpoIIE family protein phosphatase [Candidatus Zixiibacteriota bacterium]
MRESAEFFDILIQAIRKETEAFNYYYDASDKSPSAESRSLLIQLAEEERKHRTILVQEYQNLKKLLSGESKEDFLEKERISFRIPEEPAFKRVQTLKEMDLAAVRMPTEFAGGDFFDTFILRDEGKMGLLIFDVMGHGLETTELKSAAAMRWGKLKELDLEKGAHSLLCSPSSVVTLLNGLLWDECQRLASFLTLFYALVDLPKHRLIYASAGHEPPLLSTKTGYRQLLEADLIIGIDKEKTYAEESLEIQTGDVLILFTDGVVESLNPRDEEFGRKNLIRVVEESKDLNAAEIAKRVLAALRDFVLGLPLTDEFTLAVAKIDY